MSHLVTLVSGSNAFSGNATRIINLGKYISDASMLFSPPRTELKNAAFTHFSNRLLAMSEKAVKMASDDARMVHCFKTLPTSGVPSLLGKLKGKPLILDWDDFEGFGGFADQDSFPYNHIADRFEKWIVKRADALTVVSPFLEKKAREFGFTKDVHFIPNGADTEGIKYSFHENKGRLKLLFVGLLYKSSDLDFVLESMTHVNDMDLTIVGDGPRRKEFERLAAKLGLNVTFVGMKNRGEIKQYLYACDIALMPFVDNISNRSRSPVKLGEYLAAGKPVVTNDVGIMQAVIENGKNGIKTKDNPEAFAKGVMKLEDVKLRRSISLNARKTAEQYSWGKIAGKLSRVYATFSRQ